LGVSGGGGIFNEYTTPPGELIEKQEFIFPKNEG